MLTLGIDPGIATTGWGLLQEIKGEFGLLDYGCIKTSKHLKSEERLLKIHQDLKKILTEKKPDFVAVEKLFFSANTKTALAVGEARGVIVFTIAESRIPLAEYTPLQVKLAVTGYGKADKNQVQQMTKALLRLNEIPKPDDAADGVALALCHLQSYRMEQKIQ